MRRALATFGVALTLVTLAAACSGGQHGARLTVSIVDLPAGTAASVRVTGPDNFRATLTRTTTLSGPNGSYRLAVAPVRVAGTTYYAQVGVIDASAPGRATIDYAEQVPDTTKLLTANDVGLVPGTKPDGTVIEFRPGTTGARAAPGDVLVIAAGPATPHTLFRKVVSVTPLADRVEVTTAPAQLRDAIPRGRLHARLPVDPAATVNLSNGDGSCGVGGSGTTGLFDATGNVDISGSVDFDIAWGFVTPNYVKLVGQVSESADASITSTAVLTCKVQKDSPGIDGPSFAIDLGPIPIEVTPTLVAHAEAKGTIAVTAGYGFHEHGSAKAGFTWGTPDGSNQDLHPIAGADAHFTSGPPPEDPNETVFAGLGPQVNFDLDGIDGGPYVNFLGGVNVKNSPTGGGRYQVEVQSDSRLNVGVRLNWGPLNFNVAQPFDLATSTLFKATYGNAASPTPSPSPTPSTSWACTAKTFEQLLANPIETEVTPAGQPRCLDGYAEMTFNNPAGQPAPFFFVFSAGKWSLIEGGDTVPSKACAVIPHQVMSAWGYNCNGPATSPSSSSKSSGGSAAPGHGSPAAVVAGLYQSELAGNWSTTDGVCSYVQPDAQAVCQAYSGGTATGNYQIHATAIQGTEALVEVTGTITAPGSPTVSNSDPASGMPNSQADFQSVFNSLTSSTATIMSPAPCIEVGGQWYADVGG